MLSFMFILFQIGLNSMKLEMLVHRNRAQFLLQRIRRFASEIVLSRHFSFYSEVFYFYSFGLIYSLLILSFTHPFLCFLILHVSIRKVFLVICNTVLLPVICWPRSGLRWHLFYIWSVLCHNGMVHRWQDLDV